MTWQPSLRSVVTVVTTRSVLVTSRQCFSLLSFYLSLFLSFSLVKEERGSYFPVDLILDQISLVSNTPFAVYHTHKHTNKVYKDADNR